MPRSRLRDGASFTSRPSRYWRTKDAKAVLDRLENSRLTVRSFALREGLSVQRLYRWRRALARGEGAAPGFVEVVGAGSAAHVEVVLPSGVVLRVPAGFDAATVRRLVDALEGHARC